MALWIPVTLFAACVQALRFMLQKQLRAASLSTMGATWVRFGYGMPWVWAGFLILLVITGWSVPPLSAEFWMWAVIGGGSQIIGTLCVVALFQMRNFAVGITLKKTETLQTAIIGFALLGDTISVGGGIAIAVGIFAVLLLSGSGEWTGWRQALNRSILIGLASGIAFGFSSIGYRGATLALGDAPLVLRSFTALTVVITGQALALGLWIALRERGQITACLAAWRTGALVGLFSAAGSFGWFTAFALQNAAYVKALGQVELLFSVAISRFRFGERLTAREGAGIALLTLSVVLLILAV